MRFVKVGWRAGLTLVLVAAGLTSSGLPAQAATSVAAADGTYRFVAKLTIGEPGQAGSTTCSGALVAPQWVITAKDCFGPSGVASGPPPRPTTATVGRTSLSTSTGTVSAVDRLVSHPGRNVVLARLTSPASNITPIRLARDVPRYGQVLRVAGYGRTATEWVPDRLHTAQFTVGWWADQTATTFDVAARVPATASICKGDAGGPAFRELESGPQLVAINGSSWQAGCIAETQTRQGAVEVRVDDLLDWVRGTIVDFPLADGSLYREPAGAIAVITGGAPVWFDSVEEISATGYPQSWAAVPDGTFGLLPAVPRNGTLVAAPNHGIYVVAGGAKIWFNSPQEIIDTGYGGTAPTIVPTRHLDTFPDVPRDGTVVSGPGHGIYVVAGGALVWFASPQEMVDSGYGGVAPAILPARYLSGLSGTPRDGTMVTTPSGDVFLTVGGAKKHFRSWDEIVESGYVDAPLTVLPTRYLEGLPTAPSD
ncbi:S1 family peptidase [Micromonospora chokoriensis]|uniref:Secreted trypsin-like serine protease n=1 Tax=Micromonospora chokoriensis TaxID=356851 RepID=A0A1C4X6W1_9ACTN|nr:trypsin-like serine protease [Micromonospora chokoriensis]SCF04185.1 Secreted trypsin-like serine protease [Micromonospora chokoriensis]